MALKGCEKRSVYSRELQQEGQRSPRSHLAGLGALVGRIVLHSVFVWVTAPVAPSIDLGVTHTF